MNAAEENVELVMLLIWIAERLAEDKRYADVVARINAWHDGTYLQMQCNFERVWDCAMR